MENRITLEKKMELKQELAIELVIAEEEVKRLKKMLRELDDSIYDERYKIK